MNVLMVNYEFPPVGGGGGWANLCILKEFARFSDLQIDLVTCKPQPGNAIERFSDTIRVHKIGIHKKDLHYWRKPEVLEWLFKARPYYNRLIRDNHYDLAHAFFAFPSGWLCYQSRKKLPYLVSLRGSDVPGYNVRLGLDYMLLSGLFKRIWKRASAVIANSSGLSVLAKKFTPDVAIGVIPNGVDMTTYHPPESIQLHSPLRLLTVSRLIQRKRLDRAIEAAAALIKMGIAVELTIAGEGNLMRQLKELTVQLNITEQVKFIGRVETDDMPGLYRDHDIFLMTSDHEGMSNAMLEAVSSGLPVVTTDCEGVDELISENGLIIQSPDANAFAEAIRSIQSDPQLFQAMSQTACQKAKQFSWSTVAAEYMKYFASILEMK